MYEPEIQRVIARLEALVEEIATVAVDAAKAEADYKTAYAQARLRHRAVASLNGDKLTEAYLTDLADDECEELRLNYLIATSLLTARRDALRASQAQLDGLRTLAAGIRSVTN
jgi:hypothetical protein